MTTLLISEKTDAEFEQVLRTWTKRGGNIRRLGKYWVKEEDLVNKPIAIYGNQTFSLVLAQIYNVNLISPDDKLISRLQSKWTKRDIHLITLGDLRESDFPVFVKPVIPKLFLAGIFQTLDDFKKVTGGLKSTEQVLTSAILDIQAEVRSYIFDRQIKDLALYEGSADINEARKFLCDFLDDTQNELPKVVVIDLGYSKQTGWFVLEFNACWGAGLNNCSAEKIIDCIITATENRLENSIGPIAGPE